MAENAPAFVPLWTQQQADAHLNPITCSNRDVMRRTPAMVLTMTPDQLVAMAKDKPEEFAIRCQILAAIQEHAQAEATHYAEAMDRMLWAACEAGIAPLDDQVAAGETP